jgi:thymidylate synthase
MRFANAAQALISLSESVMTTGALVKVRGSITRELRHQSVTLTKPLDRSIVVAGRRNNIFATIAESMWVLAGRNDIEFLAPYLPRAAEFTDDGETWRAGYGPRLRNWYGTDQLDAVRRLLIDEPTTRRAVMSIFDPALDYASSRDIPCTNWLAFSLRDGVLDMSIAIRSNDLFWGFSGINTFEWSVIQEVMAFWVGAQVGSAHYFIGSLHIYDRHFARSQEIIAGPGATTAWSEPDRSAFSTPASEMDEALSTWFSIENELRLSGESAKVDEQPDLLLRDYSRMLGAFWTYTSHGREAAERTLLGVQDPALREAGTDYFAWRSGDTVSSIHWVTARELIPDVIRLHRSKDAIYGDSWKKRGEQMAVLANIARKLDRLSKFEPDRPSGPEGWFDTAVDLFVYAVKYKTFLLDAVGVAPPGPATWSDGPEGFEIQVRQYNRDIDAEAVRDLSAAIESAEYSFQEIEDSVAGNAPLAARLLLVDALIASAASVLETAYALSPAAAASQIAEW